MMPWGLSPRVRGSLAPRSFKSPWYRVYPRVCGGAFEFEHVSLGPPGLSPRVRGSLWPSVRRRADVGSIPACAGEPADLHFVDVCLRVYPRVCGGAVNRRDSKDVAEGLSPRVRGSRLPHQEPRPVRGSIPACAGEPCRDGSRG